MEQQETVQDRDRLTQLGVHLLNEQLNQGQITPDEFEEQSYRLMTPAQQLQYLRLKYAGNGQIEEEVEA